jgi:hypothetical protein
MNKDLIYPEDSFFENINITKEKIPEIQKKLTSVYDELSKLKINGNEEFDKLKERFDKYKELFDKFIKSRNGISMDDNSPFIYMPNDNIQFDEEQFKKELLSGLIDINQIDNYENKFDIMNENINYYLREIEIYKTEIENYNRIIDELINVKFINTDIKYKLENEITEYDYQEVVEKTNLNEFIFNNDEKFNIFINFLDNFTHKLKLIKNEDELVKNNQLLFQFTDTIKKIDIPNIEFELKTIDKNIESYQKQLELIENKIRIETNKDLIHDLNIKKTYIEIKLNQIIKQNGGNLFEMTRITPKLIEIMKKVDILNIKLKEIKDLNKFAINIKSRLIMYKTYLILIIQNEFNQKQKIIFKYINRGLVQYYLSVILSITEKFNINADGINDGIRFFNSYHYILILKFKNFFKLLLDFPDFTINKIIDIEKSSDNIKLLFTLFNGFKDLLDSYNEQFQNKITIYARINDKIKNNKPLFETNPEDSRILMVNKKNCLNIGQYGTENIQFSEVFDSDRFKETLTISKYMTLASQISKGKGILFMTYGYSGTGKTFTLFGTKTKQGLLQSTLLNINNIQKVLFRVYEIYGEGLSTKDFWTDFDSYDIYSYNLNVEQKLEMKGGEIGVEKYISIVNNNIIDKDKRKDYLKNGQEDFIILAHDHQDMKNVFKNFSQFIDDLDDIRKKEKRIVPTKNNPASSRSIIVYEFFNVIDETTIVPFILVDMPGREEITPTYYDQFIITNSQLDNINKVKIKAAMLNPLYLSLLDINIIDKLKDKFKLKDEDMPKNIKEKIMLVFNKLNEFIDKKNLSGLKDFLMNYLDKNNIIIQKNQLDLIYSGYFINENIVGLIKIILVNLLQKKDITNKIIFNQSDKLKIENIKQNILESVKQFYQYNRDKKVYDINIKSFEALLDTKNILDENYDSKKIFNSDNLVLLPLLERYNKDHKFDPKNMKFIYSDFNKPLNVLSVDSFKIFYLFTNDDADKKCLYQYKLLDNTKSLIYGLKE